MTTKRLLNLKGSRLALINAERKRQISLSKITNIKEGGIKESGPSHQPVNSRRLHKSHEYYAKEGGNGSLTLAIANNNKIPDNIKTSWSNNTARQNEVLSYKSESTTLAPSKLLAQSKPSTQVVRSKRLRIHKIKTIKMTKMKLDPMKITKFFQIIQDQQLVTKITNNTQLRPNLPSGKGILRVGGKAMTSLEYALREAGKSKLKPVATPIQETLTILKQGDSPHLRSGGAGPSYSQIPVLTNLYNQGNYSNLVGRNVRVASLGSVLVTIQEAIDQISTAKATKKLLNLRSKRALSTWHAARYNKGYPIRGQNTHSNAKTARGKR